MDFPLFIIASFNDFKKAFHDTSVAKVLYGRSNKSFVGARIKFVNPGHDESHQKLIIDRFHSFKGKLN